MERLEEGGGGEKGSPNLRPSADVVAVITHSNSTSSGTCISLQS